MLQRHQVYLSTIDPAAGELARKYGLGIEIAEFCTAYNMDDRFETTDTVVQQEIEGNPHRIFHGPFNELFPCAIDPLARKLALHRFHQALTLSAEYGAQKTVFHGGYTPRLYFPIWYVEQSVTFWRGFLEQHPNCSICLENVLEEQPEMLLDIVRQVNDSRLRLCLDLGHVNAYSQVPAQQWIDSWGEWLSHVHAHNNDGSADTHSSLDQGTLPMWSLLQNCSDVTVTLELPEIGNNIRWLQENELL